MDLPPQQYLDQATLVHSAESVNAAIDQIAHQLNHDYGDSQPILLCVMTGGAYFAGQLLAKLNFPLEFDYVQATRYRESTKGHQLEWLQHPKCTIKNRRIILLDDILDEGSTLSAIRDVCIGLGASEVKVAVLVEKRLARIKPITADYVGLQVPDLYVFGCGMDVYGWWRNLPAIYALKSD
jgi:hypoxanthine phosphoribosyltransferase